MALHLKFQISNFKWPRGGHAPLPRFIGWAVICICALAMASVVGCRKPPLPEMRVPILMYHNLVEQFNNSTADDVWTVSAANFEKHLQALQAQGYCSIWPDELAEVVKGRPFWQFFKKQPLPAKPVIITFDDGFLSTITIAEPLLRRHGFKAMVYLITDKISDTPQERQTYRNTPCLTWEEVRAAQKRGILAFGVHSHTHPKHPVQTEKEIGISTELFRARLGQRPDSFCYPHGQYNESLVSAVRAARYTTAMICEDAVAIVGAHTDLLKLPRVSVYGGTQNFVLQVLPRSQTASNEVGCIIRNMGRPVPVVPRLMGANLSDEESWLPPTKLGPQPQEWRWKIPTQTDLSKLRLEIWDRHRLLLLFTAP